MEFLGDFAAWAWQRHHNPLSWYIRPLFLLPYCYFAYKRSPAGMALTLVALATSMFWFPRPAHVDARAVAFLEMERQCLTGQWTLVKVVLAALVPALFLLLGWAFWRRSWAVGIATVNVASLVKVAWSFYYTGAAAWSLVPAAMLGLLLCNAAFLLALRKYRRARPQPES